MSDKPKRIPPKPRFNSRDSFLMEDMAKGPFETLRFLDTFGNDADGNNPQEAEQ